LRREARKLHLTQRNSQRFGNSRICPSSLSVGDFLKRSSITSQTLVGGLSQTYATVGRVLVGFIAILLIIMPWTEHFWHFDGFLVSGQDFEFGLLALATIFSLILVLSKRREQSVAFFLAVLGWLSSNFQSVIQSGQRNRYGQFSASAFRFRRHCAPLSSPALRIYNLPIQV
jgi:hypothetical protein